MSSRHWVVRHIGRFARHVTTYAEALTKGWHKSEPETSTAPVPILSKRQRRKLRKRGIDPDLLLPPSLDIPQTLPEETPPNRQQDLGILQRLRTVSLSNRLQGSESLQRLRKKILSSRLQDYFKLIHQYTGPTSKRLWNRSRMEHFLTWIRGDQRQHFGSSCRIPDLFHRSDTIYFALQSQQLTWRHASPRVHHDVFDAAQKVGKVERVIGYFFKNKMLCVEALKLSGYGSPLYFDGSIHPIAENKRLALLGDRVLSLAVCEIWYRTGNTTKQYTEMDQDTVTRASLAARGRALGFHHSILMPSPLPHARPAMIAETFEAILGAVYVDSGNQLSAVTDVIKRIGLDRHHLLQMPEELLQELAQVQDVRDAEGAVEVDNAGSVEAGNAMDEPANVRRVLL